MLVTLDYLEGWLVSRVDFLFFNNGGLQILTDPLGDGGPVNFGGCHGSRGCCVC